MCPVCQQWDVFIDMLMGKVLRQITFGISACNYVGFLLAFLFELKFRGLATNTMSNVNAGLTF